MHKNNNNKKRSIASSCIGNLPDSQLRLESKTEPSVAKAQNYMERGHTTWKKRILGRGTPHILSWWREQWGENKNWVGGIQHILCWGGTIRVGTQHNIERKYVRKPFRHLPDTFWNITDIFQTYPNTFYTPSRHFITPSRHSPYTSWTPQTQSRVQ